MLLLVRMDNENINMKSTFQMYKSYFIALIMLLTLTQVAVPNTKDSLKHSGKVPLVFVLKIAAEIDPRTNRYHELALEKATEMEADYVVIEMDTYGGALNDADDMRSRNLNFERPLYVYINKDAASAGALISISCDSIYMTKGASIGAATVVTGQGEAAPDKYQSYMRSIMRSTAEAKGRNPKIAEAMVDQDIDLDSIAQEGKVITFSTSEAIRYGFCEAEVSGIEEIMARSGVEEYETYEYKLGAADSIVQFFINPFISGILILIILGGIYYELQSPGVGFPILASLIALVLYLTPYYLNGLAANWEIAMLFIGLLLIGLEVFVIPGFGVAGIAGLSATLMALVLIMLNNDVFDFAFVPNSSVINAVIATLAGMSGFIVVLFFGSEKLFNSKAFQRVTLTDTQEKEKGFTSNKPQKSMMGKRGVAFTILRPSGKVMIDEQIFDATSRGAYIEEGKTIEVIGESTSSLKVKEIIIISEQDKNV